MHDARPVVAVERSPPLVAPVKLAALAPASMAHSAFKRSRCESVIPVIPWVIEHKGSPRVAENPPEGGRKSAQIGLFRKRTLFRLTRIPIFGKLGLRDTATQTDFQSPPFQAGF